MLRLDPEARTLLLAATDVARLRGATACGRIDVAVAALVMSHPDHRPGGRPSTVGMPSPPAMPLDGPLERLLATTDANHELTAQQLLDDARRDPAAATILHDHDHDRASGAVR